MEEEESEDDVLTVITSGSDHALVYWIPTDTVDSARVTLKYNDRCLSSVVPHIHTIVCRAQHNTTIITTIHYHTVTHTV